MKIIVLQENLSKNLLLAGKFLPGKITTISALNHFLLVAEQGKISITATNLETTCVAQLPGKIEEEGQILLPAKMMLSVLPSLTGEKVVISEKDKTVLVTSGKGEMTLKTEEVSSYPKNEVVIEEKEGFILSSSIIEKIARKVCFSASADLVRIELTGVSFNSGASRTSVAATDGFRLSLLNLQETIGIEGSILPARLVLLLAALIKEEKEEKIRVIFTKEKGRIVFELAKRKLITRLIEGKFPDYRKIIPDSSHIQVKIGRQELFDAVRLASVFAREASNVIRFKLHNATLTVSAQAPQAGENKTELTVQKEGDDVDIAFNFRFLLDFLSVSECEEVVLKTNGSLLPCIFTYTDDPEYLHVIMPVRLQESQ